VNAENNNETGKRKQGQNVPSIVITVMHIFYLVDKD